MSGWLDPLRATLDAAPNPVTAFVRNDDGGWDDPRLFALLDLFADHEAPIDVAVIPCELTPELASELLRRREATGGLVGLHQHGYRHANHETAGRKCEFGASRSLAHQRADIADGQRVLRAELGDALDPIFTPPWNRCTHETGAALAELGIPVLSRDSTAELLGRSDLAELAVQVDWFAARKGERLARWDLGMLLAERAAGPAPLGVMLHHAVMDEVERDGVRELLTVLTGHPNVTLRPMAHLAVPARSSNEETS